MIKAAPVEYLAQLFGLDGRVALVTGARHGIGEAVANALSRAGARVIVTGRSQDRLPTIGDEQLALDVTDPWQVEATISRCGRLDIVVNNAAVPATGPTDALSVAEWDRVMATNLRGPFLISRSAAATMERGGRIINVSSTYARLAAPNRAAYAAAKAGLEHLTRVLALEWAPRGITVNAVAPGATPTESRAPVLGTEEARRSRAAEIPLGRLGEVDDVVGAVLLLASDAGAFITGQTIVVDGGLTA